MTIQRMIDYFKDKGFEVTKEYDSKTNKYTFTISKNGTKCVGEYEFIPGLPPHSVYTRARMFVDKLIARFNRADYMDSLYPSVFFMGGRTNGKTNLLAEYCKADVVNTMRLYDMQHPFAIKDVIFNDPATIILWMDGTKTVVKAENESFDPEKGLAMAIAKKALGNKGNYYETFKKWLPEKKPEVGISVKVSAKKMASGLNKATSDLKKLSKEIKKLTSK